nr:hypothetical protein [Tanacetum cinerariifolium]
TELCLVRKVLIVGVVEALAKQVGNVCLGFPAKLQPSSSFWPTGFSLRGWISLMWRIWTYIAACRKECRPTASFLRMVHHVANNRDVSTAVLPLMVARLKRMS